MVDNLLLLEGSIAMAIILIPIRQRNLGCN